MPDIIIKTHKLMRQYRTSKKAEGVLAALKQLFYNNVEIKHALLPLDLEITSGEIVGLVGANGAGKTTLLKLLAGLIYPTSGSAQVLGYTPWERKNPFLQQISLLLGQKNQLWWDIPAIDSFQLLITIYDLDKKAVKQRIEELASRLDCHHVLHVPLRRLSLGERMKMELIGALLHSPKVLFLDEPTIGLDVVAQNNIRQFILEELKGRGVTVILTSHYMDDIAQLADRLLLMSHGAIVYDGNVKQFITQSHMMSKHLIVDFIEPVKQDITLHNGSKIAAGALTYEQDLNISELMHILQSLTEKTSIRDIKIEEPDFEDVIHKFFEKESRLHQARHHH